jgi:uncharacterized protein YdaU (DUF1376 family)
MKYIAKNCDYIKSERTPFLKLYTDDWIAGTIELSFEEKGFYFEVLLRMWDRKGTLPDDANWLACALGCNPRTVRKLVARLAATGHLQVSDGVVSNRRMMREISQNITKSHKQSDANPTPIQPELGSNSTGTMAKNSTITTRVLLPLPEAIFQNPEKKEEQASPVLVAEVLAGDLSDEMILNVAKWANMPTANAGQWLATTVAAFGQEITTQSYHKMITDKAQGVIVSRPLATWSTIAQRMKASADSKTTGKRAPWVEEKIKRQRDTMKMAKEMGLI